jgi:hypothetical protein
MNLTAIQTADHAPDGSPAPLPPDAPPPAATGISWRDAAVLAVALAFAALLHLLQPNRKANWEETVLPGGLRYAYNADSITFVWLAARFPSGFAEAPLGEERRMRPLYPAMGWTLAMALRPLERAVPDRFARAVETAIRTKGVA